MAILPIPQEKELGEIQQAIAADLFKFFRKRLKGWVVEFDGEHITFGEPAIRGQVRVMIRFESTFAVTTIDRALLDKRETARGLEEVSYDYCDPQFPGNCKQNLAVLLEEAEGWFL